MTEPVDNVSTSETIPNESSSYGDTPYAPKQKGSRPETLVSGILAPKPKRKLTEAQLANLAKGREARDSNRKKRVEDKEIYVKELQEKKTAKILQEKAKIKKIVGVDSDTEEQVAEEKLIVKKPAKTIKKKIIVLPSSDEEDDETEEHIIYRKPSKAKAQPVDVPQELPSRKIIFF